MERIDGRLIHDVYLDRVVFRETFTGDGAETEFTLSGPDAAQVTFKYGAWAVGNVKTTLPSHVTKTNKKPAYDSLVPLTRNRISVSAINAAGVVTLSHAPRAIDFYIWCWYDLPNHHLLENYYREDFVASMEEEATAYGVDITVDTTNFAGIFTGADDTVQKAFDTADDHIHDGRYYTETELANQTIGSEGSRLIGFHSHTVHDHLLHITNKGVGSGCVVSDAGTLDITWTEGLVWDSDNELVMTITSGSDTCTNNAVNYIYSDYSVSTTVLQRSTSYPTGTDQTLVAIVWCQDNDIWHIEQGRYLNVTFAKLRRAAMMLFPSRVVSGMAVSEDEVTANNLDVTMTAGTIFHGNQVHETAAQINTRTTAMVRHFHAGGAWDSETNTEIDTANYDDGANKADAAPANWFKAVFLYVNGKLHWVYPRVVYGTRAQANAAPIPAIPPGLARAAYLTAIVYNADDTTFATTDWIDIRLGLAEAIATAPVTNHDYLAGITANNHHNQSHAIDGGDHTASGLTAGHFLKATGETTFAFGAHGLDAAAVGASASDHTHTFTEVNTALAAADAAIDINSQNLTNVGTIGCRPITITPSGIRDILISGNNSVDVGTSTYIYSIDATPTYTDSLSGAESVTFYGMYFSPTSSGTHNTSNVLYMRGIVGQPQLTGAVTVHSLSTLQGLQLRPNMGAVGTFPTVIGAHISYRVTGASSIITNGYSLYIPNASKVSSGVITNNYGIYIEDQVAGGTKNYSIYSAGGANYLSGKTSVGGTVSPLAQLHVDQATDNAAIPVLTLDQADISEGFINFIGSDRGAITGATDSLESVRVEVNGTVRRIAVYVDA